MPIIQNKTKMKISIRFYQTRKVKGNEVTSHLFNEVIADEKRSTRAIIHGVCNRFEKMSEIINDSKAKMVWSKSIPFNVSITIEGREHINSENLGRFNIRTSASTKKAHELRSGLLTALEMNMLMDEDKLELPIVQ